MLNSDFEDDLQEALLDDVKQRARNEIAPDLKARIQRLLREYGARHEYDVRALVDAVRVSVEREAGTVRIRAELPDPSLLFEVGTVDHVVEAREADVLSFIWERRHDPPEWVREEFEREGDGWRVFLPKVEVAGLPEGRFVRDALAEMRRELES